MRIDKQIRMICAESGLSAAEIARRLGKSPQAFSQKIKRGGSTLDDLSEIAAVTGCSLECRFVFPDGVTIDVS